MLTLVGSTLLKLGGGSLPLILMHTHALKTYLSRGGGAIYLVEKIIRYGIVATLARPLNNLANFQF